MLLELRSASVGYGRGAPVLTGVSLALEPGELVCLIGPNGAGKTTLLRTIGGATPLLGGQVMLAGGDLTRMSRQALARLVAVVTTEPVRPPMMSARELVALGRIPHTNWMHQLTEADERAVDDALDWTGSAGLGRRMADELSDGERQRVMVARALAQQPKLLLLDEPTAYLDVNRRLELMDLLRRLATEHGLAVIASTHDLELAARHADTLWLVDDAGRVVSGTPESVIRDGDVTRAFGSAVGEHLAHLLR